MGDLNIERSKALYNAAGVDFKAAQDILTEYSDKELPADKLEQVNKLMEAAETKQNQARLMEKAAKGIEFTSSVNEGDRLQIPGGSSATEDKAASEELQVKAFNQFLRVGTNGLDAEHRKALVEMKAAFNEGTNNQGGYLVPIQYSNELVTALSAESIMRAAGARVQSISSKTFKQPSLTNTTRAVLTAEAAAFDEAEATFGELTFTPYKYTRLVKASDEVLDDAEVDLYRDVILPDILQAFAAGENADFTTGTGSSQPEGIVTGGTVGVTLSAGQTTTISSADSLIDLYHALGYLYRAKAKWMMNDAVLKIVRKLKDTTNQYIWQPGLQAGQPDQILGKPVITNNSMATASANAKTVLFADFSYFKIVDRKGLEIKTLNELYAANGQVGWRAYKRYDSKVLLATAVQILQQSAT
jgi:HK97 family phage major capsid protein